ncbi:hypothetical protein ACLK1T_19095 [Escherichia coli]
MKWSTRLIQCMNFHADNPSRHENGMRITPALAGDKLVDARLTTLLAVALSLMKSIWPAE